MNTRLILVEGLPGSGKSTTAQFISSMLTELGVSHSLHLELSDNSPIKFLSPSTPRFKEDLVGQWSRLANNLQDCSRLAVLESAYWQWTTDSMVANNYAHDDVVAINTSLDDIIASLAPKLVYIARTDVESQIRWIFSSRGEKWANMIIERDLQLPYHQSRGHKDLEGLITFFEECQSYTDELFHQLQFRKVKIHDPHRDWEGAHCRIADFIRAGM